MRPADNIKAAAIAMASVAREWLHDLVTATAFLTRVPMPHPDGAHPANFVRAHRAFPLVGAVIGAIVGAFYLILLVAIGLPALGAAACAFGAGVLLTGGLHEDGLADLADGFGGGRDRAAKLDIMRDSRLGTYGALILLVSFTAKASSLAVLPQGAVVSALIAVHALSRGILPIMAITMPYARADGLAATAGKPDVATAAVAVVVGIAIALLALPFPSAISATIVAAACAALVGILAMRQIGGQTGDVLGGAEQVAETAVLLFLAAWFST
jgi:adenosylcobinamide-GDP ribazoletransferase